jgi:hypothetical protein
MGIRRFKPYCRETRITLQAGCIVIDFKACMMLCPAERAQSDRPTECAVKAAFLFNFTKFLEWPESSFDGADSSIVIGIIGDDPFGDNLTGIVAGHKAQRRGIVVRNKCYGENLRHISAKLLALPRVINQNEMVR